MVDKIKAFGEAAKSAILYVVGPILAVVGYILYLRSENEKLAAKIATEKASAQLKGTIAEKEVKENEANSKTSAYESIRDQYLQQQRELRSTRTEGDEKGHRLF